MQRVRMNPRSTSIRDVGVPGLTMHEANTLKAPQTSTCKSLPGIPGLLNLIIAQESGTFWPVLGNFTYLGPHLTEVNAAASKHPTLATVWLGANDVLKYMGSGGRFTGGESQRSAGGGGYPHHDLDAAARRGARRRRESAEHRRDRLLPERNETEEAQRLPGPHVRRLPVHDRRLTARVRQPLC